MTLERIIHFSLRLVAYLGGVGGGIFLRVLPGAIIDGPFQGPSAIGYQYEN